MEDSLILLDTNIFIEHLRQKEKSKSHLSKLSHHYDLATTSITVYELFAGAVTPSHENDIHQILSGIEIYSFDEESAKISAKERLRFLKENKQFEIRDILIGGIVLKHNLPLATLNSKHFIFFSDIKLVDLSLL